MPIYEYNCRGCGHRFETLVWASSTPACPKCESQKLEKLPSVPALTPNPNKAMGAPTPWQNARGMPGYCPVNPE